MNTDFSDANSITALESQPPFAITWRTLPAMTHSHPAHSDNVPKLKAGMMPAPKVKGILQNEG